MQVGIINEENFPQILRGISQKRRHGVLELHVGDQIVEVFFYQGKIVDVFRNKQTILKQIAHRLVARGSLYEGEWLVADVSAPILLEQSEIAGFELSDEILRKMSQQRALENLYAIDVHAGSYYNFRIEFVASPLDEALQISVGQLLLDLVGYSEVHSLFVTHCAEDLVLSRGQPADREYTFEEQDLIWLVDGEMNISMLRESSMLNRLTFEETVISLLQEQILSKLNISENLSSMPDVYDLDASLDACIDQAFKGSASLSSPERLISEICSEKHAECEQHLQKVPRTTFSAIRSLERLSSWAMSSAHTPDVVFTLFFLFAVIAPWFLW